MHKVPRHHDMITYESLTSVVCLIAQVPALQPLRQKVSFQTATALQELLSGRLRPKGNEEAVKDSGSTSKPRAPAKPAKNSETHPAA